MRGQGSHKGEEIQVLRTNLRHCFHHPAWDSHKQEPSWPRSCLPNTGTTGTGDAAQSTGHVEDKASSPGGTHKHLHTSHPAFHSPWCWAAPQFPLQHGLLFTHCTHYVLHSQGCTLTFRIGRGGKNGSKAELKVSAIKAFDTSFCLFLSK